MCVPRPPNTTRERHKIVKVPLIMFSLCMRACVAKRSRRKVRKTVVIFHWDTCSLMNYSSCYTSTCSAHKQRGRQSESVSRVSTKSSIFRHHQGSSSRELCHRVQGIHNNITSHSCTLLLEILLFSQMVTAATTALVIVYCQLFEAGPVPLVSILDMTCERCCGTETPTMSVRIIMPVTGPMSRPLYSAGGGITAVAWRIF